MQLSCGCAGTVLSKTQIKGKSKMMARLVVSAFGDIWSLKKLCMEVNSAMAKKLLIGIYGIYQYENNSSVAWNSTFKGTPCLPHGMKYR